MHAPVFGHQGKEVVKRFVMLAMTSTTTLKLDFCPRPPPALKGLKVREPRAVAKASDCCIRVTCTIASSVVLLS